MVEIIIKEYDDKVECINITLNETVRFNKMVDLGLSLKWLHEINNIKTKSGHKYLYSLYVYQGYFLWTLIQYQLYEDLKIFSKYYQLINYLRQFTSLKLDLSGCSPELKYYPLINLNNESDLYTKYILKKIIKKIIKKISKLYFYSVKKLWNFYCFMYPREVLVYTTNNINKNDRCDSRFNKIYFLLNKINVKYHEIFHTTGFVSAISMWPRYRRIVGFLESFEFDKIEFTGITDSTLDFSNVDKNVHEFFSKMYPYYVSWTSAKIKTIDKIRNNLKGKKFKVLLAMDDMRKASVLYLAAYLENIDVILIQHGLLTRFHVGWMLPGIPVNHQYPAYKYLVHSYYWKRLLKKYNSSLYNSAIVVSGWYEYGHKQHQVLTSNLFKKISNKDINVLLLFETLWPSLFEIRQFVTILAKADNIIIHFKVRKDYAEHLQIDSYFSNSPKGPDKTINELSLDFLQSIDVIIGSHSSLLYQLLYYEIPIVRISTSYKFGEQLIGDNLATPWFINDNLYEVINKALDLNKSILSERKNKFCGNSNSIDYEKIISNELNYKGHLLG